MNLKSPEEIAQNLLTCRKMNTALQTKYRNVGLPESTYGACETAIDIGVSANAIEFFKMLNGLIKMSEFPEENISFDDVVQIFTDRSDEILNIVHSSKENEDVVFISGNEHIDTFKVTITALDSVLHSASIIWLAHQGAKTLTGEID